MESGEVSDRAELGTGDDADVDFMQSAVGLVWRAIVLWVYCCFCWGLPVWWALMQSKSSRYQEVNK